MKRRKWNEFVSGTTCLFLPLAILPQMTDDGEIKTIASWYGPGFQGRKTASGERFDQNKMTAASRTLPFGTKLNVRNLSNGKTCTVVINDRGPYVRGRGIDLSHEAARRLGIGGIARVCYSPVPQYKPQPDDQGDSFALVAKAAKQNTFESNNTNSTVNDVSEVTIQEGSALIEGSTENAATRQSPGTPQTQSQAQAQLAIEKPQIKVQPRLVGLQPQMVAQQRSADEQPRLTMLRSSLFIEQADDTGANGTIQYAEPLQAAHSIKPKLPVIVAKADHLGRVSKPNAHKAQSTQVASMAQTHKLSVFHDERLASSNIGRQIGRNFGKAASAYKHVGVKRNQQLTIAMHNQKRSAHSRTYYLASAQRKQGPKVGRAIHGFTVKLAHLCHGLKGILASL